MLFALLFAIILMVVGAVLGTAAIINHRSPVARKERMRAQGRIRSWQEEYLQSLGACRDFSHGGRYNNTRYWNVDWKFCRDHLNGWNVAGGWMREGDLLQLLRMVQCRYNIVYWHEYSKRWCVTTACELVEKADRDEIHGWRYVRLPNGELIYFAN